MSIILFAIIGATIDAGVPYWICFSIYGFWKVTKAIARLLRGDNDE